MTGHRQFKVMIEIKEIPLVPSQLRKFTQLQVDMYEDNPIMFRH